MLLLYLRSPSTHSWKIRSGEGYEECGGKSDSFEKKTPPAYCFIP